MGTNSMFSEADTPKMFPAIGFDASGSAANLDGLGFGENPKGLNPVCEDCDDGGSPKPDPNRPVPEYKLGVAPDAPLPKRFLDGVPFPKRPVPAEELEGMVDLPNGGFKGAVAAKILTSFPTPVETKIYSQICGLIAYCLHI